MEYDIYLTSDVLDRAVRHAICRSYGAVNAWIKDEKSNEPLVIRYTYRQPAGPMGSEQEEAWVSNCISITKADFLKDQF